MAFWADEERGRTLTELEGRRLPKSPRHTRYVGMSDAELEMWFRLKKELGMSGSAVFRTALHGLFYATFQRRVP